MSAGSEGTADQKTDLSMLYYMMSRIMSFVIDKRNTQRS